jgi:aryl-alcohol dehydrogenase-like predicted oxidoreductase
MHAVAGCDDGYVQVRYIGVSNETSYGVMRFVQAAEQLGLPKIVSIQNSYSLLVRSASRSNNL